MTSLLCGELEGGVELFKREPIFRNGRKDNAGNYQPASLSSAPGKIMEQIPGKMLGCPNSWKCSRPGWMGF